MPLTRAKAQQRKQALSSGAWFSFALGGHFHVQYVRNEQFQKKFDRLKKAALSAHGFSPKNDEAILPFDVVEEVYAKAMFNTLVDGWKEVNGDDGTPLEFTEANLVAILQDYGDDRLSNQILAFTSERENFHQEELQVALRD